MLRVETAHLASGLPPVHALSSRRLHPSPALARRDSALTREVILPPPVAPASSAGEQLAAALAHGNSALLDERWNLRLELKDEEIARLYAQGLTRGALVWRAGMPEWRPLLITPELSRLLHHTPITLRDASEAALDDELTLPRPARPPSGVEAHDQAERGRSKIPTVAPMALDIVSPASTSAPRRRWELLAVAALSFALAWFARGEDAASPPMAAPVVAAPAALLPPVQPSSSNPPTATPDPGIPTVALTDLPLLGEARGSATRATRYAATSARHSGAASGSSGASPTRSQLMAALNQVANVASGCGERGGPVRVVITFAGSGVARSIQVSGKELPSLVRSCIIGAASRARVATFTGDPVTVSKTL